MIGLDDYEVYYLGAAGKVFFFETIKATCATDACSQGEAKRILLGAHDVIYRGGGLSWDDETLRLLPRRGRPKETQAATHTAVSTVTERAPDEIEWVVTYLDQAYRVLSSRTLTATDDFEACEKGWTLAPADAVDFTLAGPGYEEAPEELEELQRRHARRERSPEASPCVVYPLPVVPLVNYEIHFLDDDNSVTRIETVAATDCDHACMLALQNDPDAEFMVSGPGHVKWDERLMTKIGLLEPVPAGVIAA